MNNGCNAQILTIFGFNETKYKFMFSGLDRITPGQVGPVVDVHGVPECSIKINLMMSKFGIFLHFIT